MDPGPGPAPLLLPGEGSEWGPLFPVPGRVPNLTVAEGHNWASMSTRHMGHLKKEKSIYEILFSDLLYHSSVDISIWIIINDIIKKEKKWVLVNFGLEFWWLELNIHNVKVNQFRNVFLVSSILPKNEQKQFYMTQYGHSQSEKKLVLGDKYHRSIKVHN